MAKKKRKGSRRRYKSRRKSAPKKDRAVPLGAAVGAAVTGKKMLLDKTDEGYISVVDALMYSGWTPTQRVTQASDRLVSNAMDLDRYVPFVAGALVSGSKRIPLIGLVAKPADKMIRRLSKGKVSL